MGVLKKVFWMSFFTLAAIGCGSNNSSTEVILREADYILELHATKERIKPAITEEEERLLLQQYRRGESPTPPPPSWPHFIEVHEIKQRFGDGRLMTIWSRETNRSARASLMNQFDTFSIFEGWSVNSCHYLLCNAYKSLLLIEITEGPDSTMHVREVELMKLVKSRNLALFSLDTSSKSILITAALFDKFKFSVAMDDEDLPVRSVRRSGKLVHITDNTWDTFEERIDTDAESTDEANQAIHDLAQGSGFDGQGHLEVQWWNEIGPQARAKVFIRLISRVTEIRRRAGLYKDSTSSEIEIEGQLPQDLASLWDGYREQLGLEPIGKLPLSSFLLVSKFYDTQKKYFKREVIPRVNNKLNGLSGKDRLEYARNPQPEICPTELDVALALLSEDSDPTIRKAVIENPWTDPFVILSMMEDETNPDVFAALDAYEKEVHIIPPEDERPLPPGW